MQQLTRPWRRVWLVAALALPATLAPSSHLLAQGAPPKDRLTLADYFNWEDVGNPALSPDGRQVLYTRTWIDQLNDRRESSVWIMNADGTRNRFLVKGSDARWSPDGTRIAYVAPGEPGGAQLWVRYMDAEGATTQITRLTEAPSEIEWSPDGKSIAFGMLVRQSDDWRIAMPAAPRGAKWVEPPRVVTKVRYRADRQGFLENGLRQLFTVPADGGTPRQITSGEWPANGNSWTPDGKALLFTSNRVADAEYTWRQSDIYKVDVASGTVTPLTKRNGPDGSPVPSPDGRYIAYTGYDSTDATWKDAILYVMDADGSNPRALTEKLDRSPAGMMWAPDASGVYFNAENEGSRHLYFASLKGEVRQVTKGAQVLTVTDLGKSFLAVGTMSTASRPTDIVAFDVRTPTPRWLTDVNGDVLAGKQLATTEEVWYTSVDGYKIQGWIVKPADFDPKKKYPLMLEIHGGPHSMYNVGFSFARQDHAANGYLILYTNPRGSTGYGSAFGNAIKNAYPGKDYDDLMAGVDTVINRGYVDRNRLYVFGCSGGGVLTSWIVGHTNRFAAASANCPVTNWLSFVGTTDGSSWYYNFAKYPWDDPSEHLKRSPLMYVGNVQTPTMLMTGVNDLRTPMGQTEEYYEALKIRKVPTAMIRFNNEWHGTSSTPSNFLRTQLYLRSWFEKYTQPPAAKVTQE
ncbi:S9 family peptidase [Gemmatimonas sp.]|jgi:dipeptidyl aminopeptidase/acylaminoacyl peptidase|uniref:S9 family peptidase n=1 Tax=Gemmatimonas sp. TaxID=1962908 RepID=UPI0022BECB97|nr:S9 family peptidase [Gemmatimonas sp.]MCA2985685.1 S9 family peptidase [Gemmatimonas sp.]MCA2994859.1 S9 family peptidase [Gemmatimonas sp.]MCZ8011244.1 S9 family peptidase [Gemmatimonas sp.]MCZ8266601.1 S9 family peptidase [Gemmatimonas sp.]